MGKPCERLQKIIDWNDEMNAGMSKKLSALLKDGSTREILGFSMLPFGLLTILTMINTSLNLYFSDVLGLTMSQISFILMGSKIWDAINDPVMGLIVDKTRTKWGKCRPYLLWMAVPNMIATMLLFSPVNFGNKGNFIFALLAYLLFYTTYTAIDIPYQGLMPLVFPESKKRVQAISISNIVGSIGTILPSILFFPIAGAFGKGQAAEKKGYFLAAIVFACMSGIPIIYSFFHTKEKVYIKNQNPKYGKALKIVFSDKKMVVLLVMVFFAAIPNMGAIFLPYFTKWNCAGIFNLPAGMTNESILFPVLNIMSGASYMLSMALVPPLLKKLDKKTLFIWMSLIGAAGDIFTFVVGAWLVPYNTVAGFVVYTLLRFVTNFPVGMSLVLITAIFSDAVDEMEMRTGERLEGAIFSFKSLVNKIAIAGFNALVLNIIDRVGYNPTAMAEASENATKMLPDNFKPVLTAIFFMLTGLGAIGLVAQALPMFFYKFDEKKYEKDIHAFRAEKERRLQEELDAMAQAAER